MNKKRPQTPKSKNIYENITVNNYLNYEVIIDMDKKETINNNKNVKKEKFSVKGGDKKNKIIFFQDNKYNNFPINPNNNNKKININVDRSENELNYLKKIEILENTIKHRDNIIKKLKDKNAKKDKIFKDYKKVLDDNKIKDNKIKDLKEKICNLKDKLINKEEQIKILKEKESLKKKLNIIQKQNDFFINKKEVNKILNNKIENNEKENLILLKEKEISELKIKLENQIKLNEENKKKLDDYDRIKDKEKQLNKNIQIFLEKEKELNKKMSVFTIQENQLIKKISEYKEIELNKRMSEDSERENELNRKTSNISDKERELNQRMSEVSEREKVNNQENQMEKNLNKETNLNKNEYKKNYEEEYNNLLIRNKELEKEINVLKQIINKKPLKLYKKPTLIGLNNIGATCFMNSTLQCLSQTKELTNYFLNQNNKEKILNNNISIKNKNEKQLSPIYLELIQKLWEKNNSESYSPNNFMKIINELNPLFKAGEAGDSKDFIIFVLEQLHNELKCPVNYNYKNQKVNEPLNQYNQKNSFNHFFNEFRQQCSIISDIFFGINQTTNICLNCKNIYNEKKLCEPICYNYEIFNSLIFPLEEVKKMKKKIMKIHQNQTNYIFTSQNKINNDIVSLYDCFLYNQKDEVFTGENKNYCNNCKQLYDSIYNTKIYVSPNILVLIFNRGKGNIYDVKVDFNETIDITNYVILKDKPRIIYNLYGVITHIGRSGPNAHFIASCKSPINKLWYRYNDNIVSGITNLQSEVINFGTPYILFYKKI